MTLNETLFTVISIIILLCISGFLSGTETAMTASSRARLVQWEKNGNEKASIALKLLENTENLIGSLLIGNNFVNILSSALATSLFIHLFGEIGVIITTIIMTILVVVFSEVLPKVYALSNADKMATQVAPAIKTLVWILKPFNYAVRKIVDSILERIRSGEKRKDHSEENEEELRGAIELHHGDDPDYKHEREMLRSVMDLDDTNISEAFTHRKNVKFLDINTPPKLLIDTVISSPFSYFPVIDGDDNIIGIMHGKNVLRLYHKSIKQNKEFKPRKAIIEAWFVPEVTSMLDQLQAFRDRAENFALVVDEYGTYMGCITMTDILEHIVGDISINNEKKSIRQESDASYLIDGDELIRNVNRELDWNLSDEHASTMAGYIMHETQALPSEGQIFVFGNYRYIIAKRNRQQITKIRAEAIRRKST